MLPLIAGIVSSLISANLGKVAQGVLDKGLDVVQDKLGITLEPNMSQEKLQEVQAKAQLHEEYMTKETNANTADARAMNTAIQTSSTAGFLVQNSAYILDFVIVSAAVICSWLAFFQGVPAENKELVYMGLGSLWTMAGTVVNFHRGSSRGSQNKDAVIDKISARL